MNRDTLPPSVTPAELPPDPPRGFMARFRNYFLTGLIVAGPIAINFYLTWWFVTWVDGLVVFPSPGMWSIVLISQAPSVEVANNLPGQEEHISVFLPCAPNPTTGFFFYVPKSKIIEVEMSAEDAATLIMSCGVVQPGSDPQKKIAALAGMANAARVANASALQPVS